MKGTALAPEDRDVMPAMASTSSVDRSRSPAYAWLILVILFYVQMVNFVDKAVVGIAAPAIMKDLSLSASEYGWVASSFYALYAIGGLLVAAAFGHRSPGRVLIWLLIIWTLAQTPALLATSAGMLIFSRVMLGAGEGAGTPTVINCCYEWFPPERRSFPTAILFFGNTAGKIVAAPLLTIMMLSFGWRSAFGMCALLGAIGVGAWLLMGRRGPWAAPAFSSSHGSSGFAILRKKALWRNPSIVGMCVVSFCGYWIIGFSISWLAPYLRLSLAFDASQTGWIIAGIYTGQSIMLFALSWLSDAMLRWGMSPRIARSGVMSGCMLLSALAFVGCAFIHQPLINIFLFMIGTALPTAALALSPAIIASLVPDAWRNQTVGLIMAGVTLSGFFAPVTTGLLVDWQHGGFSAALLAIGAIALIGGIISLLYVDPARRCVEQ